MLICQVLHILQVFISTCFNFLGHSRKQGTFSKACGQTSLLIHTKQMENLCIMREKESFYRAFLTLSNCNTWFCGINKDLEKDAALHYGFGLLLYSRDVNGKSVKNSLLFKQNFSNCIYSSPIPPKQSYFSYKISGFHLVADQNFRVFN